MKIILKKSLTFVLCILPLAVIAGVATAFYEIGTGLIPEEAVIQMSMPALIASVASQTVILSVVCGFLGYILAEKTGLLRKFSFNKKSTLTAIIGGALCGILFFLLDYLIFANLLPKVAEYYTSYPFSLAYFTSEVVYGGVVEEILMRWFLMSLCALVLWKLLARKSIKGEIPSWIFVVSNVLVAVVFALGHFPANIALFGGLNFLIVLRCMLLNGTFGIVFGWLYRKHGIQYAMIAHAVTHLCCDGLLFLALRVL